MLYTEREILIVGSFPINTLYNTNIDIQVTINILLYITEYSIKSIKTQKRYSKTDSFRKLIYFLEAEIKNY